MTICISAVLATKSGFNKRKLWLCALLQQITHEQALHQGKKRKKKTQKTICVKTYSEALQGSS